MFGFFLQSLSWAQLAIIESSCLWNKLGESLDNYTKLKIFPHSLVSISFHLWAFNEHVVDLFVYLFVCLFFIIPAPYEAKL